MRKSNNRRTEKSILLVKKLLGLVEMTSGLVNASFNLPEWQAIKMIFFAPCLWSHMFAGFRHVTLKLGKTANFKMLVLAVWMAIR